LLDEARKRGYDVRGLELSQSSAGYARETLGLEVEEMALDELAENDEFAVIVLADVIEHVDDPVALIDSCTRALLPGGVLCVVTPDPSSATARIAGRRWWGNVAAHTCLLPRKTLRELLTASGLVISHDRQLVRSFSARRWINGLAERVTALSGLLSTLGRLVGDRFMLRLSLRDERVILAHRTEVELAPRPILRNREQSQDVQVVLPSFRATRTVPSVASEMPQGSADRALLIDDASPDATVAVALSHGFDTLRHPLNRGYGASQKTGYVRSLLDGADIVVMVHADNQYDPALVPAMADPILNGEADVVIGSRLLDDRAIAGGMPRWKWIGNRFLTTIENAVFGIRLSEYHTGYRAFSADFLRSVAFLRNSDEFVFDQEIFAQIVHSGARVTEIPIPTRYFHEASSVDLLTSIRYGLKTLYVLGRFRLHRRGLRWNPLGRPAARLEATAQHDKEMTSGGVS